MRGIIARAARSRTVSAAPPLVYHQRRRISTAFKPTIFDKRGKVTDPGHIQLVTNEFEQNCFKLPKVIGHTPMANSPRKRAKVSGYLTNGTPFTVQGFSRQAEKWAKDTDRRGQRCDHGTLQQTAAEKLMAQIKQQACGKMEIFSEYETSGQKRANCVHGHDVIVSKFLEDYHGSIPDHPLPQEQFERVKNLRVKKARPESDPEL